MNKEWGGGAFAPPPPLSPHHKILDNPSKTIILKTNTNPKIKNMKKFFILVLLILVGCGSNVKISEPVVKQAPKEKIYTVPATAKGIVKGNGPVFGPITKEELEGALVSFKNLQGEVIGFRLTPQSFLKRNVSHDERGVIIREVFVEGKNSIHVNQEYGGKISLVQGEGIPQKILVRIVGEESEITIPFAFNRQRGDYRIPLNKEKGKFIRNRFGYQFTDPNTGEKIYTSRPDIKLGDLFFDQNFVNQRKIEEGGIKLPE